MRTLIAVLLVASPALAGADPAPAPPPDPLAACKAQRHAIADRASKLADAQERGRLLATMPECRNGEPASPDAAGDAGAEAKDAPHVRATTFEINAGTGILTGLGDSQFVHGIAGLNLGLGRFVVPNLALSLRVAGVTNFDHGITYLGAIGHHAQLWLGQQTWIGGGIGLGFFAGCGGGGSGCDGVSLSASFDLRAGVALAEDSSTGGTNLSVELVSDPIGPVSVTSISVLLGYQSF